jgi:hypothetical protein
MYLCVNSGEWYVYTGNELGCLLIWWMIHVYKRNEIGPGKKSTWLFCVSHWACVSPG